MKKTTGIFLAALLMAASLAGCGEKKDEMVSNMDSAASAAGSVVREGAEDVSEAVTNAVSAVAENVDSMVENGEVSDGDGVIGNEDNNHNDIPDHEESETADSTAADAE